ncbi:MAG: nitroreductase family protein [Verrucomicrobia bacterium]|nr:nitroreductase family protein [Verrucomicrobiota bacterium]MBU1734312.1 nitroreductase family protein [Verrucomicrobiota bacterium]MBU1857033.1 nitroreductase family protein [Verrucomicrobiota bacterium]
MQPNTFKTLVVKTRTVRRFDQAHRIKRADLLDLVNLARLSASGGNLQPLKFILSCDPQRNAQIFPCLAWAGYLKAWGGPVEGERPAAYIIILGDTTIRREFGCDHGIAAQCIMLGATAKGLGGCIIGSIKRERLRAGQAIPVKYEILLVLALGRPIEKVILEAVQNGDIKYWRDAKGRHHVPKRSMREIVLM